MPDSLKQPRCQKPSYRNKSSRKQFARGERPRIHPSTLTNIICAIYAAGPPWVDSTNAPTIAAVMMFNPQIKAYVFLQYIQGYFGYVLTGRGVVSRKRSSCVCDLDVSTVRWWRRCRRGVLTSPRLGYNRKSAFRVKPPLHRRLGLLILWQADPKLGYNPKLRNRDQLNFRSVLISLRSANCLLLTETI